VQRRDFLSRLGAVTAASAAGMWPFDRSHADTPNTREGAFAVRFGYHAITWEGQDLQAIEEIAGAGFSGIQLRSNIVPEYGDKPAALKAILARHGLTLVGLSSGSLTVDPAQEREQLDKHTRHAQFVKEVGGLYLQVTDDRPQNRPVTRDDQARLGRLLTELGTRTADLGIPLAYHNHMNSLGERPEEVDAVLAAADPKVVRLLLDIAHYQQGGGDPVKAITTYADRLIYLHIKDVVSPVPGDTKPPERSYKFVELGEGEVNIPAVFDALKAVKFRGWAIIELDAVPDPAKTPKQCMLTSKKFVEERLKLKV
jgi:inosose dehydratase